MHNERFPLFKCRIDRGTEPGEFFQKHALTPVLHLENRMLNHAHVPPRIHSYRGDIVARSDWVYSMFATDEGCGAGMASGTVILEYGFHVTNY